MARKRKAKKDYITLRVPAWATKLYIAIAVILLPWTVYLGVSLPSHHLSSHWDISWTGLDVGIMTTMLATAIFAYRRSIWVVIAAASTGTLLMVDAWFDIMSEHDPLLFREAIIMAFLFELPLALMSYYLAGHALHHNTK